MTVKIQTVKPGYKQTEIGVIPEDWEVNELKEVTVSVASGKSKTESELGDFPIYGSTGIIGYRKQLDYSGDKILVARVGANAGTTNKVKGHYCVSDNTLMISYQSKIDIDFAYYQLVHFNLNKLVFGSGQPLITGSQVKRILLTFPKSKLEQSAIAEVLSDTDALIERLGQLIEKKRWIKQGAMQRLLTGKQRLPGFTKKWESKRLGDIAKFYRGQGLSKADLQEEGAYQCIHYGQLFTEYKEIVNKITSHTDISNGFLSKKNDVLMPTSDVTPRGLATASCIMEDGVVLGGGILVIRLLPKYYGAFLSYFISQNKDLILKLVKGSTVFHLYANDISNLEIDFPDIEQQEAIISILSDMDAEIEALERQRAKYRNIKQGMMQSLLTGRIRLPLS